MAEQTEQAQYVPSQRLNTPYPLIDNDPHFRRVMSYARPSDWAWFGFMTALPPAFMLVAERVSPARVGKNAYPPILRLATAIGLGGGFLLLANRSSLRFYGIRENEREQKMDMREMVDKVKKGEPLYGVSELTPHMQGVAARNSRYSATFLHVIPWFNFVNHPYHGVDTKKYYQQAERELEAEKTA